MRIVWTEPALRDLAALRAYIGRDNPVAAMEQIEHILASVDGLLRFPESARLGRRAETRELVVSRTPYLVPYRIRDDVVQILRVLHGRQRWPDAI